MLGSPIRCQYTCVVSGLQNQWNMHWLSVRKCMPSGLDSIKYSSSHNTVDPIHAFYLIIVYSQESARTAKCENLFTSYSLWIVIHPPRLRRHFFQTHIINIDAPYSVEMNGERHTNSKMAHCHGTQYIIAVQ
jgi:hypothetical protein